eukprot:CAMPEP_0178946552 /NCGR_PEP_ID=MMETSP0789-20121207/4352_1 /TAXON_ID=3005 /ORGANISM="Rhizosolenia setigera, Strain CCMP 1694" /LENGTH=264 /DNA_ID=CAMNT_0020626563 /DNA_START=367 /DNA_END=1161 /DNA_ORIENTATION=-
MDDMSQEAKEYRYNVIFNVVLLLLTTTGSTEYISSGKSVWEISDIPDHVRQEIKDDVFRTGNSATMGGEGFRFKNKQRDLMGRNLRVPFIIAFRLRQAITAWRDPDVKQKPNRPLQAHEERIILVHVGDYMTAFYGLRKFIFAPIPFPLRQMTRTFLMVWIYTLPLCLMVDQESVIPQLIIMFLITFGFIGLDFVVLELEDPFGNDPNDFDDVGMASQCFLNILTAVAALDGDEYADKLRTTFKSLCADGEHETRLHKSYHDDK